MRIKNKDSFETSSFDLACALVYLGFKIEAIAHTDQPRSTFIFRREEDLDRAVESYWKGALLVEPKRFYYCQREVKAMLYQERV